jgi:predicted nuclease of predicted toxin-antitoxin system
MTFWIDAQLSPVIANWIKNQYEVECIPIRDLGLIRAEDKEIFQEAKKDNVIIITKDSDFVSLQQQYGAPPQIIFLTCGNTSNQKLMEIFGKTFNKVIELLKAGEKLVEISN